MRRELWKEDSNRDPKATVEAEKIGCLNKGSN